MVTYIYTQQKLYLFHNEILYVYVMTDLNASLPDDSDLFLDLDNLQNFYNRTLYNRLRVFQNILISCHNKIKKYTKELKRQECLFDPPRFTIGIPPYNYAELIEYLMTNLRQNGLKVEFLPTRSSLYISWKPDDVNHALYQQLKNKFLEPIDTNIFNIRPDGRYNHHDNPKHPHLKILTIPASESKIKKRIDRPQPKHLAHMSYGHTGVHDYVPVNAKALASR
jgi:hypothetical protein